MLLNFQKHLYKSYLFLGLMIGVLFSCGEEGVTKQSQESKENSLSIEEMATRHITSTLGITNGEKYDLKIYKEDLNDDHQKDAIITVNRLDFAKNEAANSEKTAKIAEMGFLGNYNFLFYFDGATKKITLPIQITSSALKPLSVTFENIQSESFKDVLVDYRILNASYKTVYFIQNEAPKMVFQWKNYSNIGDESHEAYLFDFSEGTYSPVKNIVLMQANFENPAMDVDVNTFEPKLKSSNSIAYTFFYNPTQGKYFTMKPKNE